MKSVHLLCFFFICATAQKIPYVENLVTCNVNLTKEAKRSFGFHEDAYLNVSEIIVKYGYPVEEHEVVTPDGYILTIVRIPRGRKRGKQKPGSPVLVMHGMTDSPAAWIISGPGHGLGYQLVDAGYDVWLGSFRGCRYTRRHTTLNPDTDIQFWKYSVEQMAAYDVPALIERILSVTGRPSISYVGHSIGCRMFFEMVGYVPDIYAKVNCMSCLGQAVFSGNIFNPIVRFLIEILPQVEAFANTLGFQEVFGSNSIITQLTQLLCAGHQFINGYIQKQLCAKILFLAAGDDYEQIPWDLMPKVVGHIPNGISLTTYKHFAQGIMSKKFQRFDHGLEENMRIYGTPSPPEYDLSKVTTPVSITAGKNDWLSSVKDAEILRSRLPNVFDFYVVPHYRWQHTDFMWARDAPKYVGERVIRMLKKYTNN